MWSVIDKKSLPLDHPKFNAFQHAAKVAEQDMAIMQQCVVIGEAEGKPMSALKKLLRQAGRVSPWANGVPLVAS